MPLLPSGVGREEQPIPVTAGGIVGQPLSEALVQIMTVVLKILPAEDSPVPTTPITASFWLQQELAEPASCSLKIPLLTILNLRAQCGDLSPVCYTFDSIQGVAFLLRNLNMHSLAYKVFCETWL